MMLELTEDQIRTIARLARDELGEVATFERLQEVVRAAVERLEREGPRDFPAAASAHLLVICLSRDSQNNAAVLSQGLQDTGCRITERAERVVGDFHTLLAAVERSSERANHETIRRRLADAGNKVGVRIMVQTRETLDKGNP